MDSPGDAASRAVAKPWHGWDPGREPVGRLLWQRHTEIANVSICKAVYDSWLGNTYIFALLVHMANLKPNVLLGQWSWWILDNIFEALPPG